MRNYFFHTCLLLLCTQYLLAQSVEQVDFRVEDTDVIVGYQLRGTSSFTIALLYSLDGYTWQRVPNTACSGAIGENISPANRLEIRWQPLLHTNKLEGNLSVKVQAQFRDTNFPEMVLVHGGTFSMGSNESDDEKPIHNVTVSDFYMGKYEVTVANFKRFVEETNYETDAEKGDGSSIYTGEWENKAGINWRFDAVGNLRNSEENNHPVIHVSWNDAQAYCDWLSKKTGKNYRLPSEAEWEYAAGNGNKHSKYSWGDGLPSGIKGGNVGDEKGKSVFKDWDIFDGYNDGYVYTAPVGKYAPNELGLYDMTGNVWEWCLDWYDKSYYSTSSSRNPVNNSAAVLRVLRGGSWIHDPQYSRVAHRFFSTPGNRFSFIGFRVVFPSESK